ncbi:MAG: hypothetical protein R6X18_15200 [Chloroflexota bacterium]
MSFRTSLPGPACGHDLLRDDARVGHIRLPQGRDKQVQKMAYRFTNIPAISNLI